LVSISRSGFYYQPVGETELNLELMRLIDALRWSLDFGQVVKLGSPFGEDGPYGGQTEAVFS
jgi:hypothetical protein